MVRSESGRGRRDDPAGVETAVGVRIRVLHVLPAPNGTTQYVDHMIGGAPPEIQILTFSWPRAILGAYDVLHVHWPEFLVRQRTPVGRFVKAILAHLLLLRLDLMETPVVRLLCTGSGARSVTACLAKAVNRVRFVFHPC